MGSWGQSQLDLWVVLQVVSELSSQGKDALRTLVLTPFQPAMCTEKHTPMVIESHETDR